MNKLKEPFSIGARVCHKTNSKCNEGVVVWKYADCGDSLPHVSGKVWNVHWSNGGRGIYTTEEIQRIPPKNVQKIVESQLDSEDVINDEEK